MKLIKRITVGQRLAFGFGLSSLLLVFIAGGAWWVMASLKSGVDVIVNENNQKTDIAWRMRAEVEETARSMRDLIVTRDMAVQARQHELQAAARRAMRGAVCVNTVVATPGQPT